MPKPPTPALVASLLYLGCAHAPAAPPTASPTARLYVGPSFVTAEPLSTPARAILVAASGRIERVFAEVPSPPPPDALVVTLPGAVAVPGLVDAHVHLAWIGRAQETLNLRGASSPDDTRLRVEAFVRAHPDVEVVTGQGWDQELFPERAFPDAAALGDTARLVVLTRTDGHALWTNTAGVALIARYLADIGEQPGERILRDTAGAPSGVVIDPSDRLRQVLAAPETDGDRQRWLEHGLEACAAAGLVGVHAMAMTVEELQVLAGIAARGRLPVRVTAYLDASDGSFAWFEARPPGPVALAPGLRVVGIKLFADGALGSRGAALFEPYDDAPGQLGLTPAKDELEAAARRAQAHGLQIAIHAIGDRGNSVALDVIAAAEGGDHALRHRIEHVQVVAPRDWSRFVELGVVASMQPTHATSDMGWVLARIGRERLVGAYAWRTVVERGIPLAFGSDAPVEGLSPARGIYAALTRQDRDGAPPGGWLPDERLDLGSALRAFSRGAAYAAHEEQDRGRFAPGYVFDATVYDVDTTHDPRAWLDAAVTATVLDGRVTLRR